MGEAVHRHRWGQEGGRERRRNRDADDSEKKVLVADIGKEGIKDEGRARRHHDAGDLGPGVHPPPEPPQHRGKPEPSPQGDEEPPGLLNALDARSSRQRKQDQTEHYRPTHADELSITGLRPKEAVLYITLNPLP